jgi:hypothetical protein
VTFFFYNNDAANPVKNRCIPTKYCGMNHNNVDKLTFRKLDVNGKVECKNPKTDITNTLKPKVVIPDSLKRLQEGHRCKVSSNLITKYTMKRVDEFIRFENYKTPVGKAIRLENEYMWAEDAETCSDRAKEL